MNTYPQPRRGHYSYRHRNPDGSFTLYHTSVEVLGESEKIYLVKITVPLGGHRAGDQMKVRKHNIRFNGEQQPARRYDYSNTYWNR